MSEYFVVKREKCDNCQNGWLVEKIPFNDGGDVDNIICKKCVNGYIETRENLLDALNAARITEIDCGCGLLHWGTVIGDEGQQLEWTCPKDGELHRDVNA